jgi:hypothetical protein
MQRNPQASLPPPPKEEILNSLLSYRRYLGDLPPEAAPPAAQADGAAPPVLAPGQETPKSGQEPQNEKKQR